MKAKIQFSKRLVTMLLVVSTIVLAIATLFLGVTISRRNNVNPDNSNANETVDSWQKVAEFEGGTTAHMAVVQNQLIVAGVRWSDSRSSEWYMKKLAGAAWQPSKKLPMCTYAVDNAQESATLSQISEIIEWDGNWVVGSYPKSAISTLDINGNCVPGKQTGWGWKDSNWKGASVGQVYKSAQDNSRMYYVSNNSGDGSWVGYVKDFTGKPTNGNVFGNTVLYLGNNAYDKYPTNDKKPNTNYSFGDSRGADGKPLAIAGNYIYAGLNHFGNGGEIRKLGPIPADPQSSLATKLPEDTKLPNLPNATVKYMIISPDQRTIYVAGFYNSGDRGVVYAFDVASGAKKGEATFPGNSIPQSITLNGNTLFVAVSTPFVSVDNIDYSAAQKGVATCTIDASGSVASCGNIVNLPEAIHGATDVEVYNNAVYAVGRKADGSGVVFKLGKAQAAQPQADPTATPTSTPSPSPTQSPSPTVVPTTTTAPTVTVTAVPTATVTPTTNATRAPQATATSTPTRTPTTVPTSGVGTTVVPTNTPPQVTPVDLPSTGITDGPVALYLSIGLLLVSLIAFTRRNV